LIAPSPNGAFKLIGDAPSSQLFLEDTRTHARRFVFGVTVQTMSVLWSPESSAFVANDRAASSEEDAYLYNAQTLNRLDLRKLILAADKHAARIVSDPNTGHAYGVQTPTELPNIFCPDGALPFVIGSAGQGPSWRSRNARRLLSVVKIWMAFFTARTARNKTNLIARSHGPLILKRD
jgi:hypothetical protein